VLTDLSKDQLQRQFKYRETANKGGREQSLLKKNGKRRSSIKTVLIRCAT